MTLEFKSKKESQDQELGSSLQNSNIKQTSSANKILSYVILVNPRSKVMLSRFDAQSPSLTQRLNGVLSNLKSKQSLLNAQGISWSLNHHGVISDKIAIFKFGLVFVGQNCKSSNQSSPQMLASLLPS